MNIAIIFAGGTGQRMGTEIPKQFLKIDRKPIIIHTIEKFEKNENIDAIIISCLETWIPKLEKLVKQYNIKKVKSIIPGGETGQLSIFNGINTAYKMFPKESIVLIHDGVRPFIDNNLINENIKTTKEKGSAISCVKSTETFTIINENMDIIKIPERSESLVAKAPQTFILDDIYNTHLKAMKEEKYNFIDSCTLMDHYNYHLTVVLTDYDNIKITTPKDIFLAKSIYNRRKND